MKLRFVKPLIVKLLLATPYSALNASLAFFYSIALLQNTIFKSRLRTLEKIIATIDAEKIDKRTARTRYLIANFSPLIRTLSLAKCSQNNFNKYISLNGIENLEAALTPGQGVILANSHFGMARCIPLVLARAGYAVTSIESKDLFNSTKQSPPDSLSIIEVGNGKSFLLKQVLKAQRLLNKNGLLHIAPDGLQGSSGVEVEFLGKQRRFASGFAELAKDTGAKVLPVFSSINEKGQIRVDILPALGNQEESVSQGESTNPSSPDHKIIINEYAQLLAKYWLKDPAGIRSKHANFYLNL